jgi:hypothetical protein
VFQWFHAVGLVTIVAGIWWAGRRG